MIPNIFLCAALSKAKGKNLLYFGCRHKDKDFLYKQELGIIANINDDYALSRLLRETYSTALPAATECIDKNTHAVAEKWESLGVLELRTAFSRDQAKKIYVQHLIAKDGSMLFQMLEVRSCFCGFRRAQRKILKGG